MQCDEAAIIRIADYYTILLDSLLLLLLLLLLFAFCHLAMSSPRPLGTQTQMIYQKMHNTVLISCLELKIEKILFQ